MFPSFRRIFSHNSTLIAHNSKATEGREAQRANSRGFLNPWNNDKKKKWRLEDADVQ